MNWSTPHVFKSETVEKITLTHHSFLSSVWELGTFWVVLVYKYR